MIMTVTGTPILRTSPQLSIGDAERVAAWFLHGGHGDNWRAELMADMPLVYARVYPGVDPEAILRNVRAALERIQQEQADAFAALADKHLAYAGRAHTGHFHDPSGQYDYCTDPGCPRNTAQLPYDNGYGPVPVADNS
jgi:hypothetical protein